MTAVICSGGKITVSFICIEIQYVYNDVWLTNSRAVCDFHHTIVPKMHTCLQAVAYKQAHNQHQQLPPQMLQFDLFEIHKLLIN